MPPQLCPQHRRDLGELAVVVARAGGALVGRAVAARAREARPVEEDGAGEDAVAEGQRRRLGPRLRLGVDAHRRLEEAGLRDLDGGAQLAGALGVVEVVEGVELHGDQVLGRDAVGLLPRVAAVVGVQDAAVVADDARRLAGVAVAAAEAAPVVRHAEDDDLAQVLGDAREEGAPRRDAAVGRVPDDAAVADGVAEEAVVDAEPRAVGRLGLDAVDVVERRRRARVLRLPLDLLAEVGPRRVGVEPDEDRRALVAQDGRGRAGGARVRADGEAREVRRVRDAALRLVHHERRPFVGVDLGDLQAEDRLEVGVHVVLVVDDEAPVQRLVVGAVRLPPDELVDLGLVGRLDEAAGVDAGPLRRVHQDAVPADEAGVAHEEREVVVPEEDVVDVARRRAARAVGVVGRDAGAAAVLDLPRVRRELLAVVPLPAAHAAVDDPDDRAALADHPPLEVHRRVPVDAVEALPREDAVELELRPRHVAQRRRRADARVVGRLVADGAHVHVGRDRRQVAVHVDVPRALAHALPRVAAVERAHDDAAVADRHPHVEVVLRAQPDGPRRGRAEPRPRRRVEVGAREAARRVRVLCVQVERRRVAVGRVGVDVAVAVHHRHVVKVVGAPVDARVGRLALGGGGAPQPAHAPRRRPHRVGELQHRPLEPVAAVVHDRPLGLRVAQHLAVVGAAHGVDVPVAHLRDELLPALQVQLLALHRDVGVRAHDGLPAALVLPLADLRKGASVRVGLGLANRGGGGVVEEVDHRPDVRFHRQAVPEEVRLLIRGEQRGAHDVLSQRVPIHQDGRRRRRRRRRAWVLPCYSRRGRAGRQRQISGVRLGEPAYRRAAAVHRQEQHERCQPPAAGACAMGGWGVGVDSHAG